MSDLSCLNQNSVREVINLYYESKNQPRNRLGLSEIGHQCKKFIWFRYNGYPVSNPDGLSLRLFQLGNVIEDHIISDLIGCGYSVHSQQKEVCFEHDNINIYGHIDGIIEGLLESSQPHLLEIKTAGDKFFKQLLKSGYQDWNPKYKAQIHAYMKLLNLKRCQIIVYNKNTSELYTERISFDKKYIDELFNSIVKVLKSSTEYPIKYCTGKKYESLLCGYTKKCFPTETISS